MPELAGKRLFFFSDTHLQYAAYYSLPYPFLRWRGEKDTERMLLETAAEYPAEIIIFGGDLISDAFQIPAAFRMLAALPEAELKLAVPGNWDMHRREWIRRNYWTDWYQSAGFTLLCNQMTEYCGLRIYGIDDFKLGEPAAPSGPVDLLLAHNPDVFLLEPPPVCRLALCGHTHGGQWRIPGFGALTTSSKFGKVFERGVYRNGSQTAIVSAGIGMTWKNCRWFCPPEVLYVEFTP